MEPLDFLFWTLVAALGIVTLNPWAWKGEVRKSLEHCRCFWCS